MPPKGSSTTVIEIVPPDLHEIFVTIRGVTPLLVSNGEAAVEPLAQSMTGPKQKTPKPPRDPDADFAASRYLMEDGRDGFPARGIKRALKDAGIRNKAGVGTEINATIQIDSELLLIEGEAPYCARHYVRHGGRVADLAYRACYPSWSIRVPVTFNAGVIAQEHVLSLFTLAGFSIGIGAWRPEKNGTFGRFVIDKVEVVS